MSEELAYIERELIDILTSVQSAEFETGDEVILRDQDGDTVALKDWLQNLIEEIGARG